MRAGPTILDTLVNKYIILKNITNPNELPVQEKNMVQVNNRRKKSISSMHNRKVRNWKTISDYW